MSILSGVVLMVAIGSVVQHSDQLKSWFQGEVAEPTLVEDRVSVKANDLALLDVLENDTGLADDAGTKLVVTAEPACGRVFVQRGAVQYLADGNCVGRQEFSYGIRGSDLEPVAVIVQVAPQGRPRSVDAVKPAPEPVMAEPRTKDDATAIALAKPSDADRAARPALQPGRVAEQPDDQAGRADATGPSASPMPQAPQPGIAAAPSLAGDSSGEEFALGFAAPSGMSVGAETPGAAPGALDPPEVASGAASLPAAIEPRTDLSELTAPDLSGGGAGVEGDSPMPVARPGAHSRLAAAEDGEDQAALAGSSAAPRPVAVSEPGAPMAPAGDAGIVLAAVDASAARPRAEAPAAPAVPGGVTETAAAPERVDPDPAGDGAEPVVASVVPDLAGAEPRDEGGFSFIGSLIGREDESDRAVPAGLGGGMTPSMAFARIEVPSASAAPARGDEPSIDLGSGGSLIERSEPPQIGAGADSEIALAEPTAGLGPVLDLGDALRLAPVDTTEPPLLAEPEEAEALETAALGPADQEAATPPTDSPEPAAEEPSEPAEQVASLPRADEACTVPPGVTLAVGPAAMTTVHIVSPCHAGTAAALEYGDLSLGLAIGEDGKGSLDVPGFQSSMDAALRLDDGTRLDFTMPFQNIDKVERVALGWELPVQLDLHALEFGAEEGEKGHVGPGNPRSYGDVRRTGGGFLTSFEPVDGVGDHVRVYSHYLRRGGSTGIVRLMIDFASRRTAEAETCGDGQLASPGFTVIRSARGMVERPLRRRLAAAECGSVPEGEDRMITNAVNNLVITY